MNLIKYNLQLLFINNNLNFNLNMNRFHPMSGICEPPSKPPPLTFYKPNWSFCPPYASCEILNMGGGESGRRERGSPEDIPGRPLGGLNHDV